MYRRIQWHLRDFGDNFDAFKPNYNHAIFSEEFQKTLDNDELEYFLSWLQGRIDYAVIRGQVSRCPYDKEVYSNVIYKFQQTSEKIKELIKENKREFERRKYSYQT